MRRVHLKEPGKLRRGSLKGESATIVRRGADDGKHAVSVMLPGGKREVGLTHSLAYHSRQIQLFETAMIMTGIILFRRPGPFL